MIYYFGKLFSQGPGSSLDFALKLIALLTDEDNAAQLILPGGIYNYQKIED